MFGAISEKFRTFDMQINFAIPPIFHFRRWLGEFFFPLSKLRNYYHFINQLVAQLLGISRQSLHIHELRDALNLQATLEKSVHFPSSRTNFRLFSSDSHISYLLNIYLRALRIVFVKKYDICSRLIQ